MLSSALRGGCPRPTNRCCCLSGGKLAAGVIGFILDVGTGEAGGDGRSFSTGGLG